MWHQPASQPKKNSFVLIKHYIKQIVLAKRKAQLNREKKEEKKQRKTNGKTKAASTAKRKKSLLNILNVTQL
jgi:hypothetical protein